MLNVYHRRQNFEILSEFDLIWSTSYLTSNKFRNVSLRIINARLQLMNAYLTFMKITVYVHKITKCDNGFESNPVNSSLQEFGRSYSDLVGTASLG